MKKSMQVLIDVTLSVCVVTHLTGVLTGCRSLRDEKHAAHSLADADSHEIASETFLLRASDVSVLWPLKRVATSEPDPVFLTKGDGFCLLPGLENAHGFAPVMTPTIFEELKKRIFMGMAGQCPKSSLDTRDELTLITERKHAALEKGLVRDVMCSYENWRVVGMRFDLCANRASFPQLNKDQLVSECYGEVRLVAQPFRRTAAGGYEPIDFALHLLYDQPDHEQFIADLKRVALVSRKEIERSGSSWDARYDQSEDMLRPHPGLRIEMDSCGGPVTKEMANLISRYASSSQLNGITWMTSNSGPTLWSFGAEKVRGSEELFVHPFRNFADSFSKHNLDNGVMAVDPEFTKDGGLRNVANWFDPDFRARFGKDPAPLTTYRDELKAIDDIRHPVVIDQMGPATTNCVSCHTADHALNSARSSFRLNPNLTPEEKDRLRRYLGIAPYESPAIWPPFGKPRATDNLRNFGYAAGYEFGVSFRAIHETKDVQGVVNNFYGDVPSSPWPIMPLVRGGPPGDPGAQPRERTWYFSFE